MIIEEYIIIGIGYRNLNHFKKLGYDAIVGVYISVLSTHLSETSNTIIRAKCDICGEETQLKKTNYTKSLKLHNYYCCLKCASYKVKKTFLKKYGVDNVFQLESIKEKIKETNIEKFGVENPQQNKDINKKTLKTNLERYGTEYTFQSDEVKEKIKQTISERYGVEHPMYSEEIKDKIKQTNLERYGFEYVQQNKNIRQKTEKTNLKKYGFKNPMQNDKIFEKQLKNSYYKKNFNELKYQGSYELDFIKKYDYLNITNYKSIEYEFNNKQRKYFPDFYYEEKNLIIEIKSNYTYNKFLEKNLAKQRCCIEQGYNFIFIIDKKYDDFENLLMNYN
jgi:acyl carrier protein